MNYINIDKTGLKDILVSIKLTNFKREHFDKHTKSYWNKFFYIQKFETINKKFHSFLTDGVSVSILLEKTNTDVIKIKTKVTNLNEKILCTQRSKKKRYIG